MTAEDDIETRLSGIEGTIEDHGRVLEILVDASVDAEETQPEGTGHGPQPSTPEADQLTHHNPRRWRHRSHRLAGSPTKTRVSKQLPWWNIDAADEELRTQVLADVQVFGDTIRKRYVLKHIPDNWSTDEALLRDFIGLLAQWEGAYASPQAGDTYPMNWRDALERFINETSTYRDRLNNQKATNGF